MTDIVGQVKQSVKTTIEPWGREVREVGEGTHRYNDISEEKYFVSIKEEGDHGCRVTFGKSYQEWYDIILKQIQRPGGLTLEDLPTLVL